MRKKYFLLLFIFIFLCLPNFVKAEEVHSNEYMKYSNLLEEEKDANLWNISLKKIENNKIYLFSPNTIIIRNFDGKLEKSIPVDGLYANTFSDGKYIYIENVDRTLSTSYKHTFKIYDYNGNILNEASLNIDNYYVAYDHFITSDGIYFLYIRYGTSAESPWIDSYIFIDKNLNVQAFKMTNNIKIKINYNFSSFYGINALGGYNEEDSKYIYYSNGKFDKKTHEASLITGSYDYDYFKAYKSSQNNEYTYSVMTKDILEKAIQKNSENIEMVNNFITDEFSAGIVVLDKNEKIINILPVNEQYFMGIECNEFYCLTYTNSENDKSVANVYDLKLDKKLASFDSWSNNNLIDLTFVKSGNKIFALERIPRYGYNEDFYLRKYEPFIYEATEKVYMRKTFNLKNFLGSSFDQAKIEIENPDIAKIEGDYIKPLKVGSTSIKIYNNYKFYNIQFDVLDENQEIVENTDINPLTKTYLTYISMLILFIIMLIILLYLKKHRKLNKNGFDNL